MSKKKKTLKQKRLADQRLFTESHGITSQPNQPLSYTFTRKEETVTNSRGLSFSLQHDLQKTLLVSLGILVFLVVFSALLHNRVLVLPLVSLRY